MVRLGGVEEREQSAGVDDDGRHPGQRSAKPASTSSASRAIGCPLEYRAPRGRGRTLPNDARIDSRMISASDTPRSAAARLTADERSDMADFLASRRSEQWDHPSLFSRWRIREVAAHVVSYEEHGSADLVKRW